MQNYLVFISANSPGSDNTFAPRLINLDPLLDLKFGGNCLISGNISVFRKVINLYIFYTQDTWESDVSTNSAWGDYLFGAVN